MAGNTLAWTQEGTTIMNVQPTAVILTVHMIDRTDKVRVVVLLDETIISSAAVARTFITIIITIWPHKLNNSLPSCSINRTDGVKRLATSFNSVILQIKKPMIKLINFFTEVHSH